MSAWHGDAARRDGMIARFQDAVSQGQFEPDEHADANETLYHGPIYCLTGTQEPKDFAEESGYPIALASLITPVAQQFPTDEAAKIVTAWLEAPTPGAQLDAIPNLVLVETLMDPTFAAPLRTTPDASAMLDRLIALHSAETSGAPASRADWRAIRKAAVALVEAAPGDTKQSLRILETIAWPVASAPELLYDLMWSDMEARMASVAQERQIPPEAPGDHDLIDRILDEQAAAGLEQEAAFAELDRILEEQHPEFLARGEVMRGIMNEVLPLAAGTISTRVIRHLSSAPVQSA